MILNAIGLILYLATCFYILKKEYRTFIFFAFISFTQSWSLLSCFYNDLGIYNMELFRFTEPTYATFRLAVVYIVFNLGFYAATKIFRAHQLKKVDFRLTGELLNLGPLRLLVYCGAVALVVYLAYGFWHGGIPLFSGFDRFNYFESTGKIERIIVIYGFLISFLLGLFTERGKLVTPQTIGLAVFLIYLILTSNKFSALSLQMACFAAPVFARRVYHLRGKNVIGKRHLIMGLIVLVVMMSFVFASYNFLMGNSALAGEFFRSRLLAFQGELWWAVDYDYYHNEIYDANHWNVELNAILEPNEVAATDVGMKYVMIRVLGPDLAYPVIETGYLYTMAYPAILRMMVPYPVVILIQGLGGFVFFLMLYYLYYSVVYRHALRSLITITIIIPYVIVFFTGNFAVFLTTSMGFKILALIVIETVGSLPKARTI